MGREIEEEPLRSERSEELRRSVSKSITRLEIHL